LFDLLLRQLIVSGGWSEGFAAVFLMPELTTDEAVFGGPGVMNLRDTALAYPLGRRIAQR
jgi:hypothetical protein